MGAILINVGANLYGGDFEVGAILINVGAILTGAILQWGDLTSFPFANEDLAKVNSSLPSKI